MASRKILTGGNPALHKMCRPVAGFDARLRMLLDDLKKAPADANGASLVTPQVGILRRVIVVMDTEDDMLKLVGPEVLTQKGEQEGLGGYLSVPGRWDVVKRPYKMRVCTQDRNDSLFEVERKEIMARYFYHEIRHLNGHLFIEHANRLYTAEELDRMIEEQGEQEFCLWAPPILPYPP